MIKILENLEHIQKWIVKNDCQNSHDFKEMACSRFKIANEYETCRHEIGDEIYECYERNEEDNN